MAVNGVEMDNRTRKLIEEVRREVGERNTWEEETELGSGEVWAMLNKIDNLIIQQGKGYRAKAQGLKKSPWSVEGWKKAA